MKTFDEAVAVELLRLPTEHVGICARFAMHVRQHMEETVRFCPNCGSLGELFPQAHNCCPEGQAARKIPVSMAVACQELFYETIKR